MYTSVHPKFGVGAESTMGPGHQVAAEINTADSVPADVEANRKAVNDAAASSATLWISYLFLLFYLAIAAGAVTHVDLLTRNPVKLPFLGIELPLLGFFGLTPVLFLLTHIYVLV